MTSSSGRGRSHQVERRQGLDLVGHGRAQLQQERADGIDVPAVAGDGVGGVEQAGRQPVPRGLVARQLSASWSPSSSPATTARASSSASRRASVSPWALSGSFQ